MPGRPQNSFFLLRLLTVHVVLTVLQAFVYYSYPVVPITEAAALTCSVVFGLILFTIWARKRGHDLSFLTNLLAPCIKAFLLCYVIQFYFPQWRIFMLLGNGFKALGSCVCIVYCSSSLMRHFSSADSILVLSINIAIVVFSLASCIWQLSFVSVQM